MASTSTQRQGLQSCLEPQLLEPHVLMTKLSPPTSNFSNSMTCLKESNIPPQESIEENEDVSRWSFTQILNNSSPYKNQADTEEEVYVHPSKKLSSSTMNARSLEMCTESLGSETGSDISENMDEFSFFLHETDISRGVQRSKCREFKKRIKRTVTFPPPLTSISGMNNVQVRSYREGGRLVLRAVRIRSSSSYFQAHRANGRLRLSWLKDVTNILNIDTNSYEEDAMEVEQDAELENGEEAEAKCNEREPGSKTLGGEIGVGEYPRPRRCKESGSRSKGFPNWGQFWVAIS